MHKAARPFLKRARMRAALRGALYGSFLGSAVLFAALTAGQLMRFPFAFVSGAALFAACVTAGAFFFFKKARAAQPILEEIDRFYDLKDRVQTAYALETDGASADMEKAQIADAAERLSNADAKAWIPRLLPRWAWTSPCALLLACVPLLLPPPAPDPNAMTDDERIAAIEAANALSKDDSEAEQKLKRALTLREAFAALAEAEKRAEESAQSAEALATAQKTLAQDKPLSDALRGAAAEPPPDLAERLRALRDALASNPSAEAVLDALAGIETAAVSEAKLNAIADALRQLERRADPNAAETLKRIQAQKRKLAAAALNSPPQNGSPSGQTAGGNNAGTDLDNNPSARTPADLPEATLQKNAQLILETLENVGARQETVYSSKKESGKPDSEPELLPFKQAALNASRSALKNAEAGAVNAERLPAAYRDRIRRYFKAVETAARNMP